MNILDRVQDILSGKSEADKILYSDSSLDAGFVILPDMKWDTKTISNLYLQCIARNGSITNLRDLTKEHLTMLMNIRERSHEVVQGHFGLPKRSVRLYVHYQPSYCVFYLLRSTVLCKRLISKRSFPCAHRLRWPYRTERDGSRSSASTG